MEREGEEVLRHNRSMMMEEGVKNRLTDVEFLLKSEIISHKYSETS